MDLQEKARAAAQEAERRANQHLAEAAAEEAFRSASLLQRLLKKSLDVEVEVPAGDRFEVDGLIFGLKEARHERIHLALIRPCPRCGQEVYEEVYNLEALGYLLADMPGRHACGSAKPAPEPPSHPERTTRYCGEIEGESGSYEIHLSADLVNAFLVIAAELQDMSSSLAASVPA